MGTGTGAAMLTVNPPLPELLPEQNAELGARRALAEMQ